MLPVGILSRLQARGRPRIDLQRSRERRAFTREMACNSSSLGRRAYKARGLSSIS